MGRRGSFAAEVEDRGNQGPTKVPRPEVIDRDAPGSGCLGSLIQRRARNDGRCWSQGTACGGILRFRGSIQASSSTPRGAYTTRPASRAPCAPPPDRSSLPQVSSLRLPSLRASRIQHNGFRTARVFVGFRGGRDPFRAGGGGDQAREVLGSGLLLSRTIRGGAPPDRCELSFGGDEGLLSNDDGGRIRLRGFESRACFGDALVGVLPVRIEDERSQTRLISLGRQRHGFERYFAERQERGELGLDAAVLIGTYRRRGCEGRSAYRGCSRRREGDRPSRSPPRPEAGPCGSGTARRTRGAR